MIARAAGRALALKLALPLLLALVAVLGLSLLLLGTTRPQQTTTGPCAGVPSVTLGTGAIAWPMPTGSYTLTSGYGQRWGTLHAGVDLAAPIGTPIYAAHDGVVERVGAASGFGTWLVVGGALPDGTRYSTVYGHVPPSSVAQWTVGAVVSAGQQVAVVGNEGQSTGPHLHFEVWPGGRFGGASVDPIGWLSANVRDGQTAPDPAPAPGPAGDPDITLVGAVPPAGRQATMPITPERQANIDTIVGVVKGRGLPLRVAVIAVATAMQESTLRTIDFGDLAGPDSRGLYQQRAPWGPYADRMDPVTSTVLFLDGGRGGQRGLLSHDWQGQSLEQVVVATQISVGGYAKWEAQAMQLVAAAAGVDPIAAGAPFACAAV